MQVHVLEVHGRVAHAEVATHFPIDPMRCPFWETVLPISVKPGLAVAAEAGGVVGAEGVPGALSVVVFTGFLAGSIIREHLSAGTDDVLHA